MKAWDNGLLRVSENKRYLMNGDKPFFWLGDTAWLIFTNITEEEAYIYLKNRADKGFNVIQAVLVYTMPETNIVNKMSTKSVNLYGKEYWERCDRIIDTAESLGLYMALLPSWGSLVKKSILTLENVDAYIKFLTERYGKRKNIIWLLGGDIKAAGYENLYRRMADGIRKAAPNQLIGFHPFGRCSSSDWFADEEMLDFNMFQSGHRRYDQAVLNEWDDNKNTVEFFGEDNWKYVRRDYSRSSKPTIDGEPAYEWILQGLHDPSQPYWKAADVRRYAYWSVLAGAFGHTYGDNSVMQFFDKNSDGVNYGAKEEWQKAIHHEGSGQMGFLKGLMESVDFINGSEKENLLIGGQREKHDRIALFGGKDFLIAYNYSGKEFEIDLSDYQGFDMYFFSPSKGIYSYIGKSSSKICRCVMPTAFDSNTDCVLLLKKQ